MIVLVNLKEGVDPEEYERWLLETYVPAVLRSTIGRRVARLQGERPARLGRRASLPVRRYPRGKRPGTARAGHGGRGDADGSSRSCTTWPRSPRSWPSGSSDHELRRGRGGYERCRDRDDHRSCSPVCGAGDARHTAQDTVPDPAGSRRARLASCPIVPGLPRVELEPELVFLLFLPPLLYVSAIFTSWRDFQGEHEADHAPRGRTRADDDLRGRRCRPPVSGVHLGGGLRTRGDSLPHRRHSRDLRRPAPRRPPPHSNDPGRREPRQRRHGHRRSTGSQWPRWLRGRSRCGKRDCSSSSARSAGSPWGFAVGWLVIWARRHAAEDPCHTEHRSLCSRPSSPTWRRRSCRTGRGSRFHLPGDLRFSGVLAVVTTGLYLGRQRPLRNLLGVAPAGLRVLGARYVPLERSDLHPDRAPAREHHGEALRRAARTPSPSSCCTRRSSASRSYSCVSSGSSPRHTVPGGLSRHIRQRDPSPPWIRSRS